MSRTCPGQAGLLLALAAGGCGARTGTVRGTVTFAGEKLSAGTVTFFGSGETIKTSGIAADGSYQIDGIPAGLAIITVATSPPPEGVPVMPLPPLPRDMPVSTKPTFVGPAFGPYVDIPKKYRSPEQSGLSWAVRGGAQTHDIVLMP
jgi:hypothetical protein